MKVVWRWLLVREVGDAYVYPMHFNERSIFLSIEAALELMISFAAFVALLIFGILEATKNDKK